MSCKRWAIISHADIGSKLLWTSIVGPVTLPVAFHHLQRAHVTDGSPLSIVALVRVRVRVRCRSRCAHRRTGFLPGAAEKAKKC